MLAVIFEMVPRDGKTSDYLEAAATLHEHLRDMDGFISIERFQSLATPDKVLSLSFWRDEEAITRWRNLPIHRDTQRLGREHLFADYRLRVASVVRDYGMHERQQAPTDSRHTYG